MMLATVQAEDEGSKNTPEAMSVSRISIKLEFDGLVRDELLRNPLGCLQMDLFHAHRPCC